MTTSAIARSGTRVTHCCGLSRVRCVCALDTIVFVAVCVVVCAEPSPPSLADRVFYVWDMCEMRPSLSHL